MTVSGGPTTSGAPVTGHQDDPVGEGHHPLEPVLGHDHGEPEVVDQSGQRAQHLLGRGRVQGGGWLVEHKHPR